MTLGLAYENGKTSSGHVLIALAKRGEGGKCEIAPDAGFMPLRNGVFLIKTREHQVRRSLASGLSEARFRCNFVPTLCGGLKMEL